MDGRILSALCIIFIVVALIFYAGIVNATATLSITPPTQTITSGLQVAVKVSIASVANLYGYQYDITYDSNVLTYAGIAEASFLKNDGANTYCVTPDTATAGRIKNIACTRQGTTNSVSGAGNLTAITFNIKSGVTSGTTTIGLQNAKLSDINSQAIQLQTQSGTITINICTSGQTRSCTVTNSYGSCAGTQTCTSGSWGTCTITAVETCNGTDDDCDGAVDETFTNKGAACSAGVGECARSGTYVCSASGLSTVCSAVAGPPTAEICDNKDNDCDGQTDESLTATCTSLGKLGQCAVGSATCSSGSWAGCPVPQTEVCWNNIDEDCDGIDQNCAGDITGGPDGTPDNKIDISDLSAVAYDFGRSAASASNQRADVNGNGEVDIFDLVVVAKNFGKTKS
jgi:hypothetical protein